MPQVCDTRFKTFTLGCPTLGDIVQEGKYSKLSEPSNRRWIYRQAPYHVAVKSSFYRNVVEVCYILNASKAQLLHYNLAVLSFLSNKKHKYMVAISRQCLFGADKAVQISRAVFFDKGTQP